MCRSYIFCLPYTAKPESTCCSRFPIFYPSCLLLQLCFDGIENCRRFRQAIDNCNGIRAGSPIQRKILSIVHRRRPKSSKKLLTKNNDRNYLRIIYKIFIDITTVFRYTSSEQNIKYSQALLVQKM